MAGRLLRIMGGYLAAGLFAGPVIASGLMLIVFLDPAVGMPPSNAMPSILFYWALLALLAAGLAIAFASVPASLVIAVAEIARLRSAGVYAACGAVVAVACWAFFVRRDGLLDAPGFSLYQPPHRVHFTGALVVLASAAGLTAGLVYWRIAGSTAGAWRIAGRAQP